MTHPFQNILILGHKNIGDVLQDMAILKPLKDAFPHSALSMLTSPIGKTILEGNRYLSDILILDRSQKHKSVLGLLKLSQELRKKKFDLIINLKMGSYYPLFLGAKKIWSIRFKDKTMKSAKTLHAIDRYLNILKHHGISIDSQKIEMSVTYSHEDEKKIKTLLSNKGYDFQKYLVIVSPFSPWHAKEIPLSMVGKLSQELSQKHEIQVVLVGGEKDITKVNALSSFKDYFIDLTGKTTFKELAALYDQAQLVIGSDSGPFHLATNMKTPALGIFAPSNYLRSRPYFEPHHTVHCTVNLGCNPCIPGYHFMKCKVWNRTTPCMETITFEDIYSKTLEILKLH
ncbi:MAG: hypothetical protein A2Z91_06055 [Deltaproteobacteria bacterium GWA2_38_16]|nr:MAG: hypothetical protein A2Z91_06055 [Deltaproteobacteria bacterium GWA2_38_16]OGQ03750.1 MAG: hypothetical protein A3D19_02755 [Deltaproteobacteria bacterium RIFCSPHIGHO2_02_FULL_38_15]OGQ31443.1 MAG: hypothetical protein A3A72_07100 [Deltaproteobacteria bacterium RIFCSPLOWO2_01_FULL_38_9]OGQ59008.1 MAG: hypothetical protein A3G92_00400 [Deltaproteobacteria bacterium RIFCSPLOWO2_12_FULL_38_8]HBQ21312.1 hypothetical protein [Deltaproteobacteria bacterium]